MIIDYLDDFPIPTGSLPPKLRELFEPVPREPELRVDVTTFYENDPHGPGREHLHMIMASVPIAQVGSLQIVEESRHGVTSYSVPYVSELGGLADFMPSVSGNDYIVASWGNGSFYNYNLAEKVWMALGLSSRTLGGVEQRILFDDLSLPEFGVVDGKVTTQYYFSAHRNVEWSMSNEYLRRYLWMRGAYGVRIFFYEILVPDSQELRAVMSGEAHISLAPKGGWFELDIREWKGGLLIQVHASVVAIAPELCPAVNADGLEWPGIDDSITRRKADALVEMTSVYLDDRFLDRYEQSSFYDTTPTNSYEQCHCSPSYLGQWSFTDCVRVGRNMVKVPLRELYQPKPDREIVHANAFALTPAAVASFNPNEEHIVAKTDRFVKQLLDLNDNLVALGKALGSAPPADGLVKFSRVEIRKNGWLHYPEISRLAQVAPLSMTEQAFLSRCKSIHELWQHIPNGYIRDFLIKAGHARKNTTGLGSLKLMQAMLNIIERLNADGEQVDAFGSAPESDDLKTQNKALAALFVNNDLRIADAHNAGDVLGGLENIGFDTAAVNEGYGRALDHVFDGVIDGFAHLNLEIATLLAR